MARRTCDVGHEGVDVNESSMRWIIGSTAAALWVTILLTASIGLTLHWYLTIWLATAVASGGVVACLVDAMARARETRAIAVLREVIGEHAKRMEEATSGHAERLRSDVFTLERWMANRWRGDALAKHDATVEAARRGSDSGPLPSISGWPR